MLAEVLTGIWTLSHKLFFDFQLLTNPFPFFILPLWHTRRGILRSHGWLSPPALSSQIQTLLPHRTSYCMYTYFTSQEWYSFISFIGSQISGVSFRHGQEVVSTVQTDSPLQSLCVVTSVTSLATLLQQLSGLFCLPAAKTYLHFHSVLSGHNSGFDEKRVHCQASC